MDDTHPTMFPIRTAMLLLAMLLPTTANAGAAFVSVQSGNWNAPSTWDVGAVPASHDHVEITAGTTVAVDAAVPTANLAIQLGGELDIAASGSLTICTGCAFINRGTLEIGGAFTLGDGTAVSQYQNWRTILVRAGGQFLVRQQAQLATAQGTITNAGLVTVDGHLQNVMNGASTLANDGRLVINGSITNAAFMQNSGEIVIGLVDLGAGILNNDVHFTSSGGTIEIAQDAFLVSGGSFDLSDGAELTNHGLFSVPTGGSSAIETGADVHNHATVRAVGFVIAQNGGTFHNHCGGVIESGTVHGNLVHACATPPTVTSPTVADIGGTRARLGGNVTANGGAPLAERGIVFAQSALDADPMLGDTHATSIASTSATLGVFSAWAEGLQPGTAYSFKAYATTSAGATAYSNTATFTTLAAPGAPTIGTAIAGNSQARIFFTPPADSGGSPITGYTATSENGIVSDTCTSSPCYVFGLDNGTSYRFRVTATSAIGTGAPSAYSNTVVPGAGDTPPDIGAIDDQSIHEDGNATAGFTVGDDATPAAAIAVVVTSSNQALIDDATLAAGLSADDDVRLLLLQPAPNAHGVAQITVTATDADGASASRSFMLHVLAVNDPPLLSVLGDRNHAAGSSGAQTVAGFAQVQAAPQEPGETVAFNVDTVSDPDGVVASASINAAGTLAYTLTGNAGTAQLRVSARDDGGVDNGGQDTSTALFRIRVGTAPLPAVTVDIVPAPRAPGAVLVAYDVIVRNTTATSIGNLALTIAAPRLAGVTWSCAVDSGACTPAVGNGAAATRFTLPPGGDAQVDIGGTAAAGANFIEVSATLDIPTGDGAVERQRVVLVDPVGADALFGSGFE